MTNAEIHKTGRALATARQRVRGLERERNGLITTAVHHRPKIARVMLQEATGISRQRLSVLARRYQHPDPLPEGGIGGLLRRLASLRNDIRDLTIEIEHLSGVLEEVIPRLRSSGVPTGRIVHLTGLSRRSVYNVLERAHDAAGSGTVAEEFR